MTQQCGGCGGKGKYVGLLVVEDPCEECDGTGYVASKQIYFTDLLADIADRPLSKTAWKHRVVDKFDSSLLADGFSDLEQLAPPKHLFASSTTIGELASVGELADPDGIWGANFSVDDRLGDNRLILMVQFPDQWADKCTGSDEKYVAVCFQWDELCWPDRDF